MKSKTNALLAAVRDEDDRLDGGHGPDELAHMVRELAALVHDIAPGAWVREASTVEALRIYGIGDMIGYGRNFEPLRWSMPPNDSLVCYWAVESFPVRWEDEAGVYAIVRPTWDHDGVVRELLFALRVLARLAWFRVEPAEVLS